MASKLTFIFKQVFIAAAQFPAYVLSLFQQAYCKFIVGFFRDFLAKRGSGDVAVFVYYYQSACVKSAQRTLFDDNSVIFAEAGTESRGGRYVFNAVDGAESCCGKG